MAYMAIFHVLVELLDAEALDVAFDVVVVRRLVVLVLVGDFVLLVELDEVVLLATVKVVVTITNCAVKSGSMVV
jgi:hypothetical protein